MKPRTSLTDGALLAPWVVLLVAVPLVPLSPVLTGVLAAVLLVATVGIALARMGGGR